HGPRTKSPRGAEGGACADHGGAADCPGPTHGRTAGAATRSACPGRQEFAERASCLAKGSGRRSAEEADRIVAKADRDAAESDRAACRASEKTTATNDSSRQAPG